MNPWGGMTDQWVETSSNPKVSDSIPSLCYILRTPIPCSNADKGLPAVQTTTSPKGINKIVFLIKEVFMSITQRW